MRHKPLIPLAALMPAVIAGAVASWAYDSSRDDVIAKGVTVAGVDVGGMSAAEARATIERDLRPALERPVVVRHAGVRFSLSGRDAGVRADVARMVDEAVGESRDGTIVSRVARDLTGGEEDVQVPVRVTYSREAVEGLVKRVERKLDRPARDATVDFSAMTQVKEQVGLDVQAGALRRRVERALSVPGVDRTVKAPVERVQPEVTREELAEKYPVLLVADRSSFELRLYRDLKLAKEYTVAVGAVGFDTPAGLYHIQNKAVNPAWNVPESDWAGDLAGTVVPGGVPENPLKARWLGVFDGAGIHGTDQTASLGSAASHGCIRMAIPDVIELYDQISVGTPIYIG